MCSEEEWLDVVAALRKVRCVEATEIRAAMRGMESNFTSIRQLLKTSNDEEVVLLRSDSGIPIKRTLPKGTVVQVLSRLRIDEALQHVYLRLVGDQSGDCWCKTDLKLDLATDVLLDYSGLPAFESAAGRALKVLQEQHALMYDSPLNSGGVLLRRRPRRYVVWCGRVKRIRFRCSISLVRSLTLALALALSTPLFLSTTLDLALSTPLFLSTDTGCVNGAITFEGQSKAIPTLI